MIKLENQIIIEKSTYRLVAEAKGSCLQVSLTLFAPNFNNYKYFQGSTRCRSQSQNRENEKKLVRCLLRYLQKEELYTVDIRNKKLIFPEISGINGVKKSMDIELKQKFRTQKQILQQQFKRRQFHHSLFQHRSYEYLNVLNKKLDYMKRVIDQQNQKIELLQTEKEEGIPSKKVKLNKKKSEEQHKISEISQKQKQQQIKLKSYINNRNKLYFEKIQIQNQQKNSPKQDSSETNSTNKASSLQSIMQVDQKEEFSEQKSSAQSKWVVIKSALNNFSLFDNYVKFQGLKQWSRIIMNVPLINKENTSFRIKVLFSKQNFNMIGVVSQKNKSLKPSNYELSALKDKGYYQYFSPSEGQHFVGGFSTSDEIKVEINYEKQMVSWSVNGSTFASQRIGNITNQLYPCIDMYTQGDVIEWIYE